MNIHYFAAARAASATASENISVDSINPTRSLTLADLREHLGKRHTGRTPSGMSMAQVLAQCSFLVNGKTATDDLHVTDNDRIDVLPPFAGG